MKPQPFRIHVDAADLYDLKKRLLRTRWPQEPDAPPWSLGADASYMRDLVMYWAKEYDWREWEQRLNSLRNYRVATEGQILHYIIEHGSGSSPLPLLLLHGWPGSIIEFLQVIEPLAHPERKRLLSSSPACRGSDSRPRPPGRCTLARLPLRCLR